MYRWVFQKLPGPTWVKALVAVVVVVGVVFVLFEYVLPPPPRPVFGKTNGFNPVWLPPPKMTG